MFGRNKRKFFRLPVHHLLKYRVIGQDNQQGMLSFVRNVSAGGALFHCKEYIKPESMLKLEINFPSSSDSIEMNAKVLRTRALKKMGGFDVAVKFVELKDEARGFMNTKILDTYSRKKEVTMVKLLAIASLILAVAAALAAVSGRFNLLPQMVLRPTSWLSVTACLLLFSIAFSLIKNK